MCIASSSLSFSYEHRVAHELIKNGRVTLISGAREALATKPAAKLKADDRVTVTIDSSEAVAASDGKVEELEAVDLPLEVLITRLCSY